MMAKMFYTLEEAKSALGKNEEEIKQLTREGRLREFRDGPRLMFKADQVETLKGEFGTGDQVDLGPSDTGAPIGLVDSRSGSSPIISLADTGGNPSPGSLQKDDTALAADLGLSGSLGGIPSPSRSGSGLSGLSGSGGGSGINVLGESGELADPSAQTAINTGLNDQINLEGMGSGSGLLDLTRESDDTSLGADVLDEIPAGRGRPGDSGMGGSGLGGSGPGGSDFGGSGLADSGLGGSALGTPVAPAPGRMPPPVAARNTLRSPEYVERRDPLALAFGLMALGAVIFMILGMTALSGGVLGIRPAIIQAMETYQYLIVAAFGLGLVALLFIIGLIFGRLRT